MSSELFPKAGRVELFDDGDGIAWPLFVSARGNTMKSIHFFTRNYGDGPERVLVARHYDRDTHFANQRETGEYDANLDEMVEFAIAAHEQLPDEPISRELGSFVIEKLELSLERVRAGLGAQAVDGARSEG